MGAWGNIATNVVATNADTYILSTSDSTSTWSTAWPKPARPHQDGHTTYYTRSVESNWTDLERLLDELRRRLAKIAADWRVLHELLMGQEKHHVKARPPPRSVPPEDPVRSHRRPAPRAPPQNQTPDLIAGRASSLSGVSSGRAAGIAQRISAISVRLMRHMLHRGADSSRR